ncbi:helix-turn-helix domain-containing protein [Nocardia sp. NPDC050793]|uniref:AraC-like ligand-binding domain-containing protein n=1 Tax=Nocardia sp. NPDC050793 TaxID=3155159 RepID=UPI0033CAED9B
MSVILDRRSYAEFSTRGLPVGDAFPYWREVICATFVRLAAEPVGDGGFTGKIVHVPVGDIELSTVRATSQHVWRTRSLIGRDSEEYLLASIQLDGRGRVEQDGRTAVLTAGDMAFYDSVRPYSLHFDDMFHQLVVQVPKRELLLRDTRQLTARTLGGGTPGAVVSAFFTSLREVATVAGAQSAVLVPHAIGLIVAAASFAAGTEPGPYAANAVERQRVMDFLHRNFADSRLDATVIARACNVSRRSLYRIVGGDGIAAQLRRIRIERAKAMLAHDPGRPIGSLAAACGFESESGFHRAFRDVTGQTPGGYREAL